MKKLLVVLLSMALTTPSFANVLVRTNPSLSEIQAGIDACNRGDEDNCKYEHYPGVVRKTASGGRILPAGGDYILGKRLTPGSVLPKLSDRRALLRKLKSKEVEVHSFLTGESPILLASLDPGEFLAQQFQRHAVIVPAHIAELARQNGIAPHEMMLHIETRWDGNPQDAQDIINEHTALIIAIGANLVTVDQEQIDTQLEQLETLKEIAGKNANQIEALQFAIDELEERLANATAQDVLDAFVAEAIREKLEDLVNTQIDEIHAYLAGTGPIPTDNVLWDDAVERARQALLNIVAPDPDAANLVADLTGLEITIPDDVKIFDTLEADEYLSRPHVDINGTTTYPDAEFTAIFTSGSAIDNLHNYFQAEKDKQLRGHLENICPDCTEEQINRRMLNPSADELTYAYNWATTAFAVKMSIQVERFILPAIYEAGYTDGYLVGYSDGFAAGYREGYNDGYNDGYRDGYADGFRDGVNSVSDTLNGGNNE